MLVRGTVLFVSALLASGAGALALRRLWLEASTLSSPGPWALAGACGLSVLAVLLRSAWRFAARTRPESGGTLGPEKPAGASVDSFDLVGERTIEILTRFAVVLGGVTLASLSGSVSWGALTIMAMVAEEVWAWRVARGGRRFLGRLKGRRPARDSQLALDSVATIDDPAPPPASPVPSTNEAPDAVADARSKTPEVDAAGDHRDDDLIGGGADSEESAADGESAEVESCDEEVLEEEEEELEEEAWAPPGLLQQITRGVDPVRGEYVIGVLYAEFLAGQRSETLHVAFCPPLASAPKIEILPIEGPDCSIVVGQAEAFGARFELRLGRVEEESRRVAFQFEAREPSDR